jgi:hypothetical protein
MGVWPATGLESEVGRYKHIYLKFVVSKFGVLLVGVSEKIEYGAGFLEISLSLSLSLF